jgi:hypothetical protein
MGRASISRGHDPIASGIDVTGLVVLVVVSCVLTAVQNGR